MMHAFRRALFSGVKPFFFSLPSCALQLFSFYYQKRSPPRFGRKRPSLKVDMLKEEENIHFPFLHNPPNTPPFLSLSFFSLPARRRKSFSKIENSTRILRLRVACPILPSDGTIFSNRMNSPLPPFFRADRSDCLFPPRNPPPSPSNSEPFPPSPSFLETLLGSRDILPQRGPSSSPPRHM